MKMQNGWSLNKICSSAKYKKVYYDSIICTSADIWHVETVKNLIKENYSILLLIYIKMVLTKV